VSDQSTGVLRGQLQRALTDDAEARRLLSARDHRSRPERAGLAVLGAVDVVSGLLAAGLLAALLSGW
jgi:hypothetical protein